MNASRKNFSSMIDIIPQTKYNKNRTVQRRAGYVFAVFVRDRKGDSRSMS